MTDEHNAYRAIGSEFAGHGTMTHSAVQYCQTHPLDSITTAGFELARELKRWSRR